MDPRRPRQEEGVMVSGLQGLVWNEVALQHVYDLRLSQMRILGTSGEIFGRRPGRDLAFGTPGYEGAIQGPVDPGIASIRSRNCDRKEIVIFPIAHVFRRGFDAIGEIKASAA